MNERRNAHLAEAIHASGWKQWVGADKAGLTEQRLSRIKAGRSEATLDEQKALSRVLRRPVAAMFAKNRRVA